jgi:hypothetical protein
MGARSTVVTTGLVAGIVAGIVFAMFEMLVAAIQGMGFFAPLRTIAAIVLGEGTLEPSSSLTSAVVVGLIVHMMLSAVYGLVLALVVWAWTLLQQPLWSVVGATIYGFALWIVNFFAIAPVAFPWFGMADDLVQFVAHPFFFGTVLGALLAWRIARH